MPFAGQRVVLLLSRFLLALCSSWCLSNPAFATTLTGPFPATGLAGSGPDMTLASYLLATPSTPSLRLPARAGTSIDLNCHLASADNFFVNGDKLHAALELEAAARLTPQSSELQVALGELYLQLGLPEQALAVAEAARTLVPDAAQPYDIIGNAERALGHPDKAAQAYRIVIARAPGHAIGYLHLAELEHARANYAMALDLAQKALARTPDSIRARLVAADCLLHLRRTAAAAEHATAAIAIDPHNAYAYLLRGEAQRALGRNQDAEAAYREAVHCAPDLPYFAFRLADFLASQGRSAEAIVTYEGILQREPGNRAVHAALAALHQQLGHKALAAFHHGYLALADGNVEAASRDYQEATQWDPSLQDAWLGRAVVASRQGAPEKAEANLARASALGPTNPAVLTFRGELALARKDRAAAEQAFRAAIAADRTYAPALMDLADMAEANGDCAAALPLYRAASENAPQASEPHKRMGECNEAMGRLKEAAGEFSAAMALSPQDGRAANGLAWLELLRGLNLPQALLLAKRASLLRPGDPEIIDTLGWAYFRNGRPDLAVPNLQTALAGLSQESTVHYHLGMALAALGRKTEAIVEFEAAIRPGTTFPELEEARRELDQLKRGGGSHDAAAQ